jgi:hypothetical protein
VGFDAGYSIYFCGGRGSILRGAWWELILSTAGGDSMLIFVVGGDYALAVVGGIWCLL